MKKSVKLVAIFALIVALVGVFSVCLVACDDNTANEGNNTSGDNTQTAKSVDIIYYSDGAAVQAALEAGKIDYGVVGEPAATAGKAKGFGVVMDIQEQFNAATDSESGFPMSSTFIKSSLAANKTFVDAFEAMLYENLDYIAEHASEMTALLQAAGSSSAYPAAAIPTCNVGVYMDENVKATVADMLKTLNSTESVPESVYYDEAQATEQGEGSGTLKLFVPDGAPVLAVALLIAEAQTRTVAGYSIDVNIVPAAQIAQKMASKEGDIVIMPANGGANLIVKGAEYKFLCSNTQGILYMIAKGESAQIGLDDLDGKTIGCIGQGAVPQYAVEKIFIANGFTVNA